MDSSGGPPAATVGNEHSCAPTSTSLMRTDRRSVYGLSRWISWSHPSTVWIRQAVREPRERRKVSQVYIQWMTSLFNMYTRTCCGLRDGRSMLYTHVSLPFSCPIDHHSSFPRWNKINQQYVFAQPWLPYAPVGFAHHRYWMVRKPDGSSKESIGQQDIPVVEKTKKCIACLLGISSYFLLLTRDVTSYFESKRNIYSTWNGSLLPVLFLKRAVYCVKLTSKYFFKIRTEQLNIGIWRSLNLLCLSRILCVKE